MSLDIKILDFRIVSSDNNIILCRVHKDSKGSPIFSDERAGAKGTGNIFKHSTILGYYQTLEMTLDAIKKRYTLGDTVVIKTLDDYRAALKLVEKEFKKQTSKLLK